MSRTGNARGIGAEQLRAVSSSRIVRTLGWLSAPVMAELDEALRIHLAL